MEVIPDVTPAADNPRARLHTRLLQRLQNVPLLDFAGKSDPLRLTFPRISPREQHARRIAPPPTSVGKFVESATESFKYQDFFKLSARDDLCWAAECLEKQSGALKMVQRSSRGRREINDDDAEARTWFREDIIEKISAAGHNSTRFLLGEPGSGKSTLMKYLLNIERVYALKNNLVFSRFEASKFYGFCHKRAGARLGGEVLKSADSLFYLEALYDYRHMVSLRDILFNFALVVDDKGNFASHPCLGKARTIYDIVERALSAVSPNSITKVFEEITDQIDKRIFKFPFVFGLSSVEIESLVTHFARAVEEYTKKTLRICILYDGFDILAPEDTRIDREKITIMRAMLTLYDLCNPRAGNTQREGWYEIPSMRYPSELSHHALIVLRQSTYDYFVAIANGATFLRDNDCYHIGRLSPDVVVYKAVQRAVSKLKLDGGAQLGAASVSADALFNVLEVLLQRLEVFGVQQGSNSPPLLLKILAIFDGNLRDCLELVKRMISLVSEEGDTEGKLQARPSLVQIITFAMSDDSLQIARRRAYRSIELMLFFNQPLFENAINAVEDEKGDPIPGRLVKNYRHNGLIDNVFNYHKKAALIEHQAHYLLLKLRILQCFDFDEVCSKDDLIKFLKPLGYDVNDHHLIDDALVILRFTGLVAIDPFSGDIFTRTARGKALVAAFAFEPNYIEHVFHKTLFPELLIESIRDSTRQDNHERWTVCSIRNYFIFLSYLRFVEEAAQGGAFRAPENLRIFKRLQRSIVDAVDRIIEADYRENRTREISQTIAARADAEIDRVNGSWSDQGLIRKSDDILTPATPS